MSSISTGKTEALSERRQWALVLVATFCGFVAAYNVGKVPAALPAIRQEFSTSLFWSGALASSYSVIAMLLSLAFGLLVSRLGSWRVSAAGLCLLAGAGALGASADNYPGLLGSRLLEGFGFVAIAVSMPAFIGRVCDDHIRPMAMGVWGTFIPVGVTTGLLVSPFLLQSGGWRALWWAGSLVAVVVLVLAFFTLRPAHRVIAPAAMRVSPGIFSVFECGPLILAGCFAVYSATFVGLNTFLPTLWVESYGLNAATATRLTAVVVLMNVFGNLTGGWLCAKGVPIRTLLSVALFAGGVSACLVYLNGMPVSGQLLAACFCSYFSGILPATLFANVANYAKTPAHSGLIVGLFFQGAGMGQVFGPALFGAIVDYFSSWSAAPLFFISAMVVAAVLLYFLPVNPNKNTNSQSVVDNQ